MFKPSKVIRLSVPGWKVVYRAELQPNILSFISVHDVTRGPSLGGCRMVNYESGSQALTDALRLSRGMTYKNAIADLPLGGGKAVIACDPGIKGKPRKTILKNFGQFVAWVNRNEDIYYTAEDMNTTVSDMLIVQNYTDHLFGTTVDPSPYTADGVYQALRFTVDFFATDLFHGEHSLKNKKILLQGLGKVGMGILEKLYNQNTHILVSDTNKQTLKKAKQIYPNIIATPPDSYTDANIDIFMPCARGEVIKIDDIDRYKFKIVCGAANNQLQNPAAGHLLHKYGIVYCPDYITNMGGVCSIHYIEGKQLGREKTENKIKKTVRKMLATTFRTAFKKRLPFNAAVDHVVEQIVWGSSIDGLNFLNRKIFPLTYSAESKH